MKSTVKPISNVIIVGGGTAGWMAAASLATFLDNKSVSITLVESPSIGTIGVGEATIPGIRDFNFKLGIDEIDFIKKTQATFKLGIEFIDWAKIGTRFFHPFGGYGSPLHGVAFHHFVTRLRHLGHNVDLNDYSISIAMAKSNKFAQPHPNPPTPLADFKYAYHFDAALYASYLQNLAMQKSVKHISGEVTNVTVRPTDGFLESITLHDESKLTGDLFLDCSGFKGLLIEKVLHTAYEDWSGWLPCNKAIAAQSHLDEAPCPYTKAIACDAGWQWQIPLQHRMGNGYVYCDAFVEDDKAQSDFTARLSGEASSPIRHLQFTTGRRKKFWHKNCVALGLAAGFLEPLESTSISLIQTGLSKLILFFPDMSFNQADIDEANRLAKLEFERIRDFLILHYASSNRTDSEFWRYCNNMVLPDSLAQKIELYKSRGHLINYEEESFQDNSWLTMYNGFNIEPNRYDPQANNIDPNRLIRDLWQMKQLIKNAAQKSISHAEFLQRHCAAPKP